MDDLRFDHLTRGVSALLSRRALAGALGLVPLAFPGFSTARKKHKHKKRKRKVKRNAFGCVNVGGLCKKSRQCCSGICQGKKSKNLQKCQAHDQTTCLSGQTVLDCGGVSTPCTSSADQPGFCVTTTGNAGYCYVDFRCFACRKDADCVSLCGPQAACIVCSACATEGATACVAPNFGNCSI